LLSDLSLIPAADLPELDLSRRADIVADDLATKRRALARDLATLEGQISAFSAQELTDPAAPTPPPEIVEKTLLDSRRAARERYRSDKAHYAVAVATYDQMIRDNELRAKERERVTRELESLALAQVPIDIGDVVMETPPTPPAAPSIQAVMESERCSACGQTVGLRHRESMRAQNKAELQKFDKVQASYQAELVEFEKRQCWRRENREKGQQEIRRIGALNREIEKSRSALERHWHHNEERAVMDLPPEPQKPTEEYSEKRHNEVIEIVEGFRRSVVAYEYAVQKAQEMTARVRDLAPQRHALMDRIEFSSKIETALRELPRRELEIHAEHLAMSHGYKLTTEDGLALTDGRGCPYELLSAGQAMRADVELCIKVSGLMKRPVRMVFLDNADLADWVDGWQAADGYQFYWAAVTSDPEVIVEIVAR
ncbi:MAG: hypothetical protein MUP21_01335, partial [Dehalococcoidia bacterium]|nr:hypothetical protein [Dehalococcoidia bacterium]